MKLEEILKKSEEYKKIVSDLEGEGRIYLHGMVGEAIPHFALSLNESYAGSIVLFTEDDLRAKEVYSSLKN